MEKFQSLKKAIHFLCFLMVLFFQIPLSDAGCLTAREYITTLQFLRSQKDFHCTELEAQQLAMQVTEGCTGAAQRFIKMTQLLSPSGISKKNLIKIALEFSKKTDAAVETYITVFLKSFLEEYLNLDLNHSLELAQELSNFEGNILNVRNDFEQFLLFCQKTIDLALNPLQCVSFATGLAKRGATHSGGLASHWLELFHFLKSSQGPSLTTAVSLNLIENLLKDGPDAKNNFIQAYQFATSPQGLRQSPQEALDFAMKLAH